MFKLIFERLDVLSIKTACIGNRSVYEPYPGSSDTYRKNPAVKDIPGGSFFFDQNGKTAFLLADAPRIHKKHHFSTPGLDVLNMQPKNIKHRIDIKQFNNYKSIESILK